MNRSVEGSFIILRSVQNSMGLSEIEARIFRYTSVTFLKGILAPTNSASYNPIFCKQKIGFFSDLSFSVVNQLENSKIQCVIFLEINTFVLNKLSVNRERKC